MRHIRIPIMVIGLVAVLLPVGGMASTMAPAAKPPSCKEVSDDGKLWPGVRSDLLDCSELKGTADNVLGVLAALQGLYVYEESFPVFGRENVHVFYFKDRKAADLYFADAAWYKLDPGFVTTPGICGMTHAGNVLAQYRIAISIYQNCALAKPANMNLDETALHEAGHAFDYALAYERGNRLVTPSVSEGFKAEVRADLANDDATWKKASQEARWQYICASLFSNVRPGELEIALGKEYQGGHGGANRVPGAVCQLSTAGMSPYPIWRDVPPSRITADKLPYFLGDHLPSGGFEEAWAQIFALNTGRTGSPSILPLTDRSLRALLPCATYVVTQFQETGQPPPAGHYPLGCPEEEPGAYFRK
jgi:hypothetical protein